MACVSIGAAWVHGCSPVSSSADHPGSIRVVEGPQRTCANGQQLGHQGGRQLREVHPNALRHPCVVVVILWARVGEGGRRSGGMAVLCELCDWRARGMHNPAVHAGEAWRDGFIAAVAASTPLSGACGPWKPPPSPHLHAFQGSRTLGRLRSTSGRRSSFSTSICSWRPGAPPA